MQTAPGVPRVQPLKRLSYVMGSHTFILAVFEIHKNSITGHILLCLAYYAGNIVFVRFIHIIFKLINFLLCYNIPNITFTILTTFKCTAQGHQAHSHCCATITTSVSRTFSSSQTLSPLNTNSPPPPPAPEPQHLISVSMDLTPLGTSYKWILQDLSFLKK